MADMNHLRNGTFVFDGPPRFDYDSTASVPATFRFGPCCACNGTCSHTGPHTWCERHAPPLSYQANTAGPARSAQRCPVCFGSGKYRPVSQGGAEGPCHGCGTLGWVVV